MRMREQQITSIILAKETGKIEVISQIVQYELADNADAYAVPFLSTENREWEIKFGDRKDCR